MPLCEVYKAPAKSTAEIPWHVQIDDQYESSEIIL